MCVCRYDISFDHVCDITMESKSISLCLISNYSLIPNLHMFVYEHAELSSISVDSTNAKLSVLNNFDLTSVL